MGAKPRDLKPTARTAAKRATAKRTPAKRAPARKAASAAGRSRGQSARGSRGRSRDTAVTPPSPPGTPPAPPIDRIQPVSSAPLEGAAVRAPAVPIDLEPRGEEPSPLDQVADSAEPGLPVDSVPAPVLEVPSDDGWDESSF